MDEGKVNVKQIKEKNKILVLSVDRDNDLGAKAKVRGPVVGRKNVLKAANALGLADPEDSDFNAIFEAVKVHDEMRRHFPAEVALLTGDKDVGIVSDKKIADQLSRVLRKFNAAGVIFVSDGTTDEQVMPIIQSRIPIISVKRVVVKQSQKLESGYYKVRDFLKESMDNPKLSKLVYGVPAIAMILFVIFGVNGIRLIIGVIGVYFLIKGFKLEHYFYGILEEVGTAMTRRRFAFFLYVVSAAFFGLASYRGYLAVLNITAGFFEMLAAFVSASIFLFFLSAALLWTGRSFRFPHRSPKTVLAVIIFMFSISWVLFSSAEIVLNPAFTALNFMLSIAFGFALLFAGLLIEWKA